MSQLRTTAATQTPPEIVPQLAYSDIGAALAWLEHAFGFREREDARFTNAQGNIGHAEMEARGGATFMLGQGGGHDLVSPRGVGGMGTQLLSVYVDDVDEHCQRARAAGATIRADVQDRPYGRVYEVEDLEGHRWMFLQRRGPTP